MKLREFVLIILLGISIVGNGYFWYTLEKRGEATRASEVSLRTTITEKEAEIATTTARILTLEGVLTETMTMLEDQLDENNDLSRDLRREKNRNEEFEEQIEKIGSTVGTLDKLAKTDPELLQKYSKVYFLNENYVPAKLTAIPVTYLYSEATPKFIHAQVAPFLTDMLKDALEDDIKIWVTSAYRSFDEQKYLKGAYTVAYGSGANTFSADQGYSEHQLGTTLDLTTEGLGGGINGFENTPGYTWLQGNAHKYGFILSYPKGNAYYMFEPWHWRFVGTELAKELHSSGKSFYDIDQREIDSYLISLFD